MAQQTVGVIGLGIMGGAMAEGLLKAGYGVVGYDISRAAHTRLRQAGGRPLASATAVARSVDVIITSLATVAALRAVVDQMAAAQRERRAAKLVVIEMSTLPVTDKEWAAARLRASGGVMLDCPISGTAARLHERTWSIYVSGPAPVCKRIDSILHVFADLRPYVGPFSHGTKMKFIANHLVAIYNAAYGENIAFARAMGLDAQRVYDLMAHSPVLGTGVYKLRGQMMVKRKYTPATMKVDVWQKDMQVIGDMAKSVNCPTPVFNSCAPIYTMAMAMGLAKADTASACEVIETMAGMAKPRAGKGQSKAR